MKPSYGKVYQEQLARELAEKEGVTIKSARSMIKSIDALIVEHLLKNEAVSFPTSIMIYPKLAAPRVGQNPTTGESVNIPARRVAKMRVIKSLKDKLQA